MDLVCKCVDCKCSKQTDECFAYIKELTRFLKDAEFFLSKCDTCPLAKKLSEQSSELLDKLDKHH